MFLFALNTLQASKLSSTPSDEPSEGVTKNPSAQANAKDTSKSVLEEGKGALEELLRRASRKADRMLGLAREKRRGYREK